MVSSASSVYLVLKLCDVFWRHSHLSIRAVSLRDERPGPFPRCARVSARPLSSAAAMRAFAAVVILTAFSLRSRAHAHSDVTSLPIQRLVKCARDIGPSKCLSALAAFRAENALTSIKNQKADFTLARDLKDFQWERYANKSEDQMYTQLCDGTEKLLRYRSMDFDMVPGYEIKFLSKGNGTLNFDVYHSKSISLFITFLLLSVLQRIILF